MKKGNVKSSKKLKKHTSAGCPIDPIGDMETVMDQLQRMPEDGKVILFALFQLALALFQLALASVRSHEAFGVFFVRNILD